MAILGDHHIIYPSEVPHPSLRTHFERRNNRDSRREISKKRRGELPTEKDPCAWGQHSPMTLLPQNYLEYNHLSGCEKGVFQGLRQKSHPWMTDSAFLPEKQYLLWIICSLSVQEFRWNACVLMTNKASSWSKGWVWVCFVFSLGGTLCLVVVRAFPCVDPGACEGRS